MSAAEGRGSISYAFIRKRPLRRAGGDDLALAQEGAPTCADEGARVHGKLPRVTRLLALAHKFEGMLARRQAQSMAELARAGRVSRARLTQIMNLTLLAPDIQEEILNFSPMVRGCDPVILAEVLEVLRSVEWPEQRMRWRALLERRRRKA